MSLTVTIEHLAASGVAVTGHGENVAAKHAALAVLAQQWTATTGALVGRLSDHAQGLHTSAQGFAEMEQRHSRALETSGEAANAIVSRTVL